MARILQMMVKGVLQKVEEEGKDWSEVEFRQRFGRKKME